MERPDLELVYGSVLDDGDGFRLHTSRDNVYEYRQDGERDARITSGEWGWRTVVHAPAREDEACDEFAAFAEAIDDRYDTGFVDASRAFNALKEDGVVAVHEGLFRLRYRESHGFDIPPGRMGRTTRRVSRGVVDGIYAGSLGYALGFLGGIAGFAGAAALGAPSPLQETILVGTTAGGSALFGGIGALRGAPDGYSSAEIRRRELVRGGEPAAVVEDMLETVNAERVEQYLAGEPEATGDEEDDCTRVEQELDVFLDTVFHDAEQHAGVVASAWHPTYDEAKTFVSGLADVSVTEEPPSLYTDADVFQELFAYLETDDGLLDDAHILVDNVYSREDVSPEIAAWLNEAHPELVQDVGQQKALHGT